MKKIKFVKRKSTLIILMVAVFLCLVCILQILRSNREYHYEGKTVFEEGVPVNGYAIFGDVSLPVGVYRVQLDYDCSTDMQSICEVRDGTVFTGGLLTHGEQFYSGLHNTDFHMWVFERTKALELLINYDGVGDLETGDLHIYETNQLWQMGLTIILFFFIVIIIVQQIYFYEKDYGISRENKNVIFFLGLIILIASVPYLAGGAPSGADLGYHLHRIEGIKEGILAGQFPVRLEPQWVHGHGYANGVFYCGALLLFPALLRLIGFPITFCYICYCIALNIATTLIAYYVFSRIFRSKTIGVVGSALYTLSIFRIYKLIITSAVGEGSAVTFMPLVVYGFWRVFTEDKHDKRYKSSWIPLTIGYAGLIQTHVLSCEITAFLTVILCLIFIKKIFCKETFLELLKGAMGALILSLWFLVPFVDYYLREDLHIKHVWARPIQDRGLYVAQLLFNWWRLGNNALIGESGMQHSHALGIGFGFGLGFMVYGILWFGGRFRQSDEPLWKLGKLSFVLGGMLMVMSLEAFPWDTIQNMNHVAASLVSSLQFPNRFLGWASVFMTILVCCCLIFFQQRGHRLFYLGGILCAATCIMTSGMYLQDFICRDHPLLTLYNEEGMGFGYISGAEYLIEGTQEETLLYHDPFVSENVVISDYQKGALSAEFFCDNRDASAGYVDFPLLHYYGYRAYSQDKEQQFGVCKGDNNLVRVLIPGNCHTQIRVEFVSPWYWRAAEIISYAGLIWMIVILVRRQHEKISVET